MTDAFKDWHPEFQHFARELAILAKHNRVVLGRRHEGALWLHSFLALNFVALERFLRITTAGRAAPTATLPNLLEWASGRNGWITVPDRNDVIGLINKGRRAMMHGNLGLLDESSHILAELVAFSFDLLTFVDQLVASVDPTDGQVRPDARVTFVTSTIDPAIATVVLTPDEELRCIRAQNKRFGPSDRQDELLLIAEGCLCAALIEGACRSALATQPEPCTGFRGVLELAVPAVLRLPYADQADGIEKVLVVKNSLAHANYEQAAEGAGAIGVSDYFKTQFASEIDALFKIYEHLLAQVVKAKLAATSADADG